ncbi:MAG: thiamine pyrophosphate-dependent enzyme [Acidimicrobiales bacterium]
MENGHGGELALAALAPFGIDVMFTLNGGHVWPLYDAAVQRGIRIVDTRHEQTATWAAEAHSKLTRRLGLAVLTAGPGVTNGVSAMTSAHFNGSPLLVIGGRAQKAGWGTGLLQELDHVPIVASVTKLAETAMSGRAVAEVLQRAATCALTPHRGPVFVDIPADVLFAKGSAAVCGPSPARAAEPDEGLVAEVASWIAGAERPAVIAGSDVYWAGAWGDLRAAVEHLRMPCFANGMGRGCLPPRHELSFSRTRGKLRTEADLVVVAGTPLDFRLGFGKFGSARVIHLVDAPAGAVEGPAGAVEGPAGAVEGPAGAVEGPAGAVEGPAGVITVAGDLAATFRALAGWQGRRSDHEQWISHLRASEDRALLAERPLREAASDPIKPTRVFGELSRRLEPDAVVVCDGGDFASYAGKLLEPGEPGCWLDTGPYGCLGNGLGYAIGARVARPASQVVALLGDGAAGFSLMDVDTMVRHGLPAVLVVGNNGMWGLEKHPMRAVYGWDVACDLQPETRYDLVASALGGAGETVTDPAQVGPALDRAFQSGVPYLVNVITDPSDVYPRTSSLM